MLSIFPDLLSYSLLATTIIRILVGAILFYFGLLMITSKRSIFVERLATHRYPFVNFMPWVFGIISLLTGGFLVVGFLTQVVAIISAYLFLNIAVLDSGEAKIFGQGFLFYTTIIILSLTLIISGAGLFAFDLPL